MQAWSYYRPKSRGSDGAKAKPQQLAATHSLAAATLVVHCASTTHPQAHLLRATQKARSVPSLGGQPSRLKQNP